MIIDHNSYSYSQICYDSLLDHSLHELPFGTTCMWTLCDQLIDYAPIYLSSI